VSTARSTVLVIAGSDSSGGAGISRDLRTLHDLDVNGVAVVTAVTAQTNTSVRSIHFVPPATIRDQIATALASNPIRAIKIGMLGTRAAVEAVAASLPLRNEIPIVLDPVLAASSGRSLLDDDARIALIELLFPRATLITPNIPEAAALLGEPVAQGATTLMTYGTRLLADGPRAVLVKGGHGEGDESVDLLISSSADVVKLRGPRLPGTLRGTGCALSSAIAAGLSRELSLVAACREARSYVASLFDAAIEGH
jgi:hydroxymethylpyrimidine/phosphomethylpyrimidine kinase